MNAISSVNLNIGNNAITAGNISSPRDNAGLFVIDLKDNRLNGNLHTLFSRKSGQILRARGENLELITTFKDRFSYWRNKDKEQGEVERLITETIDALKVQLQELRKEKSTLEAVRFAMHFFFKNKGRLGNISPKLLNIEQLKKEESALAYFLLPKNVVRIKCEGSSFFHFFSKQFEGLDLPFPLTFKLTDELNTPSNDLNANLHSLLTRKKGEILKLEGKRLKKVTGAFEKLKYRWNRTQEDEKVKGAVSETFKALNSELSKEMSPELQKIHRVFFSCFFRKEGAIGRLSKRIFDRDAIINFEERLWWFTLPENTVCLKVGKGKYLPVTSEKFAGKYLEIQNPVNWDLADENSSEIFLSFLTRKAKQRFAWDQEKGKLKEVKGLFGRISYCRHRNEHQKAISGKFGEILKKLNEAIAQNKNDTTPLLLEHFFQEKGALGHLSKNIFNRSDLYSLTEIESSLLPPLIKKRDAFKSALKAFKTNPTKETKQNAERACIDLVVQEMTFAQKVGLSLKKIAGGGSGGARFGFDRFSKKITVVKPNDEGPHGINNPQWYAAIKQFFVSPRSCLRWNSEPLAEEDSYVIDRQLELNVVPPTDPQFIESSDFNGALIKECSVQMFVDIKDERKTLREFLEIPGWVQGFLPRTFLRWYFGGLDETQRKNYPAFIQSFLSGLRKVIGGEAKEQSIHSKIPFDEFKKLLERIAVHNFAIEDIDCHLDNILIKVEDVKEEDSIAAKLFQKAVNVSDEEIDDFVDDFFKENHFQDFLSQLFYSVEIEGEKGQKKRVMLIKHDGGSSNPHDHPSDYLSTRFKHFFEVLPHFSKPFSEELIDHLKIEKEHLPDVIVGKAIRALIKVLEEMGGSSDIIKFLMSNEQLILKWIYSENNKEREDIEDDILQKLTLPFSERIQKRYRAIYKREFQRVHKNLKTRIDSWTVMWNHVEKNKEAPMRDLLKIRTAIDFKNKLKTIKEKSKVSAGSKLNKRLTINPRTLGQSQVISYGK